MILDKQHVDSFLQYLNDQCNGIKFTLECESQERSIAFLDCKATYKEDKFVLSVYRKKTHSDRYLNFTSAHPLCMKRSVVNTLTKRVVQICSDPQEQQNELQRLESVLAENDYPTPIINQVALQVCSPSIEKPLTSTIATVKIPYRPQTGESIRSILSDYNIRTVFQLDNTLQRHLVKSKDLVDTGNQTNCVYKIKCADCPGIYIGQTSRQLKVRINEHKRLARNAPKTPELLKKLERDSAIALHALAENHTIQFDQATIIHSGLSSYPQRCYAESMAISAHPACVNRSEGFELSPIWSGLIQHIDVNRTHTHTAAHNNVPTGQTHT